MGGCATTQKKSTPQPIRLVATTLERPANNFIDALDSEDSEFQDGYDENLINQPQQQQPITIKGAQPTTQTKKKLEYLNNQPNNIKQEPSEEESQKDACNNLFFVPIYCNLELVQIEKENEAMLKNHEYVFKEKELVDENDVKILPLNDLQRNFIGECFSKRTENSCGRSREYRAFESYSKLQFYSNGNESASPI